MNRNTNAHFAKLPSVNISRSRMDRSFSHKLSGNVGDLIPIFVDSDIMPGDTVEMDTSKVIRFQTLLTPMMDNIYADVYWFFVPHRLVWDHWINFMGENSGSAWVSEVEYTVPKITVPKTSTEGSNNKSGTILDYLGFPVGQNSVYDVDVNALPVRAYCKVCDDWFRSENLTDPLNLYTGDNTVVAMAEASYINDVPKGGMPYKVAKYADYFTSCLPQPQKGDPVEISLSGGDSLVPVISNNLENDWAWQTNWGSQFPAVFKASTDGGQYYNLRRQTALSSAQGYAATDYESSENPFTDFDDLVSGLSDSKVGLSFIPANLWVPRGSLGSFTVNDMRYAFQLQKLLERDARGGTRYIEVIKSHFGVTSPDARMQRSEYIGGNRFGIVVDQVANQAQSEQDFLGDLGAFSVTHDVNSDFTHSFTEHGTLLGFLVLRYDHTYAQGLQKFWTRTSRFDYYWPVFANIGEQPVMKDEIYLVGGPVIDQDGQVEPSVFGYNEAWADYRFFMNRVSGEMRPYVSNGLFSWTLADDYSSRPSLSDGWIREDKTNVDRVLSVSSSVSNQFWADIYFSCQYTRPMPIYSVPGLIDHH